MTLATPWLDDTFACLPCQDTGVILHETEIQRLGKGYKATYASPCQECTKGSIIHAAWKAEPEKPKPFVRPPNRRLSQAELSVQAVERCSKPRSDSGDTVPF